MRSSTVKFRRITAALLAAVCVLTLMSGGYTAPAQAAMPSHSRGQVWDGVDFTELTKPDRFIYLGAYDHVGDRMGYTAVSGLESYGFLSARKDGFATPILWRIMGEDTSSGSSDGYLSMMSEYIVDIMPFNNAATEYSNIYTLSSLGRHLNSNYGFLYDFTDAEIERIPRAVVTTTSYEGSSLSYAGSAYASSFVERVSLPWATVSTTLTSTSSSFRNILGWSATDYTANGSTRAPNTNSAAAVPQKNRAAYIKSEMTPMPYWTRSSYYVKGAGTNNINSLMVSGDEASLNNLNEGDINNTRVNGFIGVRPVTRINPKEIILAAELENEYNANGNDKILQSAFFPMPARPSNDKYYRLTILSNNLALSNLRHNGAAVTSNTAINAAPGSTIRLTANLSYKSASIRDVSINYKIVDSSGKLVGGGKASGNASQSADFGIAAKKSGGGDLAQGRYTVYVWSQINRSINSNEGSVPLYFDIVVGNDNIVTLNSAAADGIPDDVSTTKIDFTFDKSVIGLRAEDITISELSGKVVKGAISGSGTAWSLAITGVAETVNAEITVSPPSGYLISSGAVKSVTIIKGPENTTSGM